MTGQGKKLPVGVDLFEKVISEEYYYLDKTAFIRQLLRWHGSVNLFTRPRRFGKTLIMSMLKAFFETGTDSALFDGLEISRDKEICEAYQGKYPVVFLSLKGIEGDSFAGAMEKTAILAANECKRLAFLLKSDRVLDTDKKIFASIMDQNADAANLQDVISVLMRMLHAHYGKRVILLIDEYDVPLDKANTRGYYDEMVNFLRGFLGGAFKTNPDLFFAVLTGCLRVSKESIFTGLNNLKADTISDERYDEYFGFTDSDVRKILADYGLSGAYGLLKEWYDGYHFGNADVYCPWDVICHCDKLLQNPNAEPELYWDNTSSNDIVRSFIGQADTVVRDEIEKLIAGGTLEKKLVLNLTYQELDKKELLWSVLYQTGYLTLDRSSGSRQRGTVSFAIPNREVREIFVEKIREWFSDEILPNHRDGLYREIWNCEAGKLQTRIRNILYDTISYYDYHENYYHALLAGLLLDGACRVKSNSETGSGRSDIVIEDDKNRRVAIIETKRSSDYDHLEKDCEIALEQIEERQYGWPYFKKKYRVIAYGIAFAEKECWVKGKIL